MSAYEIVHHEYDAIVVGAGGAGLRATLGLAEAGLKTANITKLFPTRSHTVAAQGGISAALANMGKDDWRWHFYDTVKGSDWLGDQDAIEYMTREAIPAIIELEHYGVPFSRTKEGKIYQRPFGGHDGQLRREVRRCSAPAPRPTVPATPMLHTLYQKNVEAPHPVLRRMDGTRPADPRRRRRRGQGVTRARELETGDLHRILQATRPMLLATGGYGRAYFSGLDQRPSSTPATASAWCRALGHPAAGHGVRGSSTRPACGRRGRACMTEGCARRRRDTCTNQQRRTLHGALRARRVKDLAPRDFVSSRSMDHRDQAKAAAVGPNKDDHVLAEARPPSVPRTMHSKLPAFGVRDRRQDLRQRRHHQGADPRGARPSTTRWAASRPTVQRSRSVIAEGRGQPRLRRATVSDGRGRMLACVSGARRQPPGHQLAARPLGVRPRGRQPGIVELVKPDKLHRNIKPLPANAADRTLEPASTNCSNSTGGDRHAPGSAWLTRCRSTMQQHCRGVPQAGPLMDEGVVKIAEVIDELREGHRPEGVRPLQGVQHRRACEALEVDNLIEARRRLTMVSAAENRKECARCPRPSRTIERPADDHAVDEAHRGAAHRCQAG